MNLETINSDLMAYFNYIKEAYLILFEKILDEKTVKRIKEITFDIIEIDENSEFKIKISSNIKIGLNMNLFIENNNLLGDEFNDIDDIGKTKIKYFLDNKDNVLKIIKDSLLESLLQIFINKSDPLSLGTANVISNYMSNKYNLNISNNNYKEGKLCLVLIELFGEKNFYTAILNDNIDKLNENYTKYISKNTDDDFLVLQNEINKMYDNYLKNKDKVFFIDGLYYYQQIEYDQIVCKINKIIETKRNNNDINIDRINSVEDCIRELDRYKFLYSNEEKVQLYYASLEIKKIIGKLNSSSDTEKYYQKVLEIEKSLRGLSNKTWEYYLNFPDDYKNTEQQWFLVENFDKGYKKEEADYIFTNLITNDFIKLPTIDNRYQYGFIYRIKPEAIVYTSLEKIIYRETSCENINTFQIGDKFIEVDDQRYSLLMTPRNLMVKTIDSKVSCNRILTDTKFVTKIGVFCVTSNEEDVCYQKALDLASQFDLPLIPMIPNQE